MIVLGLILIVVAAAAVLFAVIATGTLTASPLSAVGITVSVTPLTMFIAGAVALLLVVLGLALISRGTKRSVHTRRELRHLRKERANQPAAAGAAAGGTTRTDTGSDRRAADRGPGGPRTASARSDAAPRPRSREPGPGATSTPRLPADSAWAASDLPRGRGSKGASPCLDPERPEPGPRALRLLPPRGGRGRPATA